MSDSKLNQFIATGDTTSRMAFTPSPPTPASGPGPGYFWYDTTDGLCYTWDAGTSAWVAIGGGGGTLAVIGDVTTSASQGSVTFSAIPGTYKHLMIQGVARGDTSANDVDLAMTFNADGGPNYDWIEENRFGIADGNGVDQIQGMGILSAATATADYASQFEILIPNYTGTVFYKTARGGSGLLTGQSSGGMLFQGATGWWRNTDAITEVSLFPVSGNFVDGSRITLYGL